MRILDSIDTEAILGSIRKDIDNILKDDYKEENYMHTKDFIKQVEQLAFVKKTYKYIKSIQLVDEHESNIMYVRTDKYYGVDARSIAFDRLTDYEQEQLMHLVWQYISTPVDEREPEKQFALKVKHNLGFRSSASLNIGSNSKYIYIKNGTDSLNFKTIFTESELNEFFTDEQLDWIEMTFDKEWVE